MNGEFETEVSVKLEIGGGPHSNPYGGFAPFLKGAIELPDLTLVFKKEICLKHGRSVQTDYGNRCDQCDMEMRKVATDVVDSAFFSLTRTQGLADSKHGLIDCSNVWHTHHCECHLGHKCEMGCAVHDKAIEEGDGARHALYQLADEAVSAGVAALHDRMFKLERENKDLRDKLDATTKLIQEVHEALRGAPSVQVP